MTISRKEYNHQYYLDNRDKMREQMRVYRQEHIEQIRAYDRQNGREDYWELRTAALKLLGNKCQCCGFADVRALQIDHVKGGGTKENRRGWKWLAKVGQHPEQYQILCANCNWIKRHEKGEAKGRPRKA